MTKNELPTTYQTVIAKSRYARYMPEEKRRESYTESIDRYINFMYKQVKENPSISDNDRHELYTILGATCDE